jgi:hypothetical protein
LLTVVNDGRQRLFMNLQLGQFPRPDSSVLAPSKLRASIISTAFRRTFKAGVLHSSPDHMPDLTSRQTPDRPALSWLNGIKHCQAVHRRMPRCALSAPAP